jgi:hypothetical protein
MAGKFTVTDTSAEIIPADKFRGELAIQHHDGEAFALGIGEAAVADEGIILGAQVYAISLLGEQARQSIRAITASGTAAGGYQ